MKWLIIFPLKLIWWLMYTDMRFIIHVHNIMGATINNWSHFCLFSWQFLMELIILGWWIQGEHNNIDKEINRICKEADLKNHISSCNIHWTDICQHGYYVMCFMTLCHSDINLPNPKPYTCIFKVNSETVGQGLKCQTIHGYFASQNNLCVDYY